MPLRTIVHTKVRTTNRAGWRSSLIQWRFETSDLEDGSDLHELSERTDIRLVGGLTSFLRR